MKLSERIRNGPSTSKNHTIYRPHCVRTRLLDLRHAESRAASYIKLGNQYVLPCVPRHQRHRRASRSTPSASLTSVTFHTISFIDERHLPRHQRHRRARRFTPQAPSGIETALTANAIGDRDVSRYHRDSRDGLRHHYRGRLSRSTPSTSPTNRKPRRHQGKTERSSGSKER